ncbi:MAG: 2Fe-2S iron-sulfur cluster-binding protein [Parvibaculaceae bacterium]
MADRSRQFTWNGRIVPARAGDTVAAALYRAGITSIASTRKLHEPLGYSGSFIAGVLARVDGRPNVRLDQEEARNGMAVEAQNTWPAPSFDLLRAARLIRPRLVHGGFEHGRFAPRSGRAYLAWERLLANLAGVAQPPDPRLPAQERPARKVKVDVLVSGGGPAGQKAAIEAAGAGQSVALVTRGKALARHATAMGVAEERLPAAVQLFLGMELFGCYRRGTLMLGAPIRHDEGAVAFEAGRLVLATGRRSMPPLVSGNHLPAVMDAHTALLLAHAHGVPPGRAVAVIGTVGASSIAERLAALGVRIVHAGPVGALRRIRGRSRVAGIDVGRHVSCDALVHAGPWHCDPSLEFQARAEGQFQVSDVMVEADVEIRGTAAEGDEDIFVPDGLDPYTRICPCMDVTAGELVHLIDGGETDPEVLKRLTSCGMGPCQGFPCWELMLALLASRTGTRASDHTRPSHRPPRRAMTVAQAAGLCDVVEVIR